MTPFKFTPGTWQRMNPHRSKSHIISAKQQVFRNVEGRGGEVLTQLLMVAACQPNGISSDEFTANCELVAMAPQLVEFLDWLDTQGHFQALIEMDESTLDWTDDQDDLDEMTDQPTVRPQVEQVRALLAKLK